MVDHADTKVPRFEPVSGSSKKRSRMNRIAVAADRLAIRTSNHLGRQQRDRVDGGDLESGEPLKWSRPRMIFVNSMSDLFHEDIPEPKGSAHVGSVPSPRERPAIASHHKLGVALCDECPVRRPSTTAIDMAPRSMASCESCAAITARCSIACSTDARGTCSSCSICCAKTPEGSRRRISRSLRHDGKTSRPGWISSRGGLRVQPAVTPHRIGAVAFTDFGKIGRSYTYNPNQAHDQTEQSNLTDRDSSSRVDASACPRPGVSRRAAEARAV
jgi:hypothetical protein